MRRGPNRSNRRVGDKHACRSKRGEYTLARIEHFALRKNMLDHLIDFEPEVVPIAVPMTPVARATPGEVVSAQHKTADWLASLGAPTAASTEMQTAVALAQDAFKAMASPEGQTDTQKTRLLALKTPEAVRHLTGMLTAYDWEFVQQAKEIRGYAVAQLIEETKSSNANIRLKALGLLGKVTEIGLFTEKIEVKKTDMTEEEIDRKLREKLDKFMGVSDAEVLDVEPKQTPKSSDEHDIDPENPDAS